MKLFGLARDVVRFFERKHHDYLERTDKEFKERQMAFAKIKQERIKRDQKNKVEPDPKVEEEGSASQSLSPSSAQAPSQPLPPSSGDIGNPPPDEEGESRQ
jgi:hypothetical protein